MQKSSKSVIFVHLRFLAFLEGVTRWYKKFQKFWCFGTPVKAEKRVCKNVQGEGAQKSREGIYPNFCNLVTDARDQIWHF